MTGYYPYPFIDETKLGYDQVLTNMGGLVGAFAGLGFALIGVDRGLGRIKRQPTSSGA